MCLLSLNLGVETQVPQVLKPQTAPGKGKTKCGREGGPNAFKRALPSVVSEGVATSSVVTSETRTGLTLNPRN